MNAIETASLSKKYGAKTVVDKLSLSVEKGQLLSLLGMNGAGKTTTIKMLSCLVRPDGGDAAVSGHSIIREPMEVKKIINVSPQETAVAPNLSARENLELICGIYGHSRADSRRMTADMIEEFGLSEIASQRAKTLSGGWARRLSIAMALITKPEILFLDEPTLGLDVLARRELWEIIRSLKGKMTVILTTHYLEEAESLSDSIAVMRSGRVVAQGTAQQLKAQTGKDSFEDAFVELCGKGGEI